MKFTEVEIQSLFGHEAAEDEDIDRLREYYFKSTTYDQVATDLPLRILVGHKGIGKSALFQVALAEDIDNKRIALTIKPDDIINLDIDSTDFLKTIRDWKEGLTEIIAMKILTSLGAVGKDWKDKLVKYGGHLIAYLRSTLEDISDFKYGATEAAIIANFLHKSKLVIYIDDLDRGWQGRKEDVHRISALLNAVRDISRENKGIYFKVSLRSDVYYLVRTSDESTDKIEGSVVWHSWSNHEILLLLIKRIETFFGRSVDEGILLNKRPIQLLNYIEPIMETRFNGYGHWQNAPMYRVFMSLVRKRPRDLVKLCTLAARDAKAKGNEIIKTQNFENIFPQYSQGRLQDTVNEYRSELPDIERLLTNMKPNKKERTTKQGYVYKTDMLIQKLKNIESMGSFLLANGHIATPKQLAAFLYKINFLTARKELEDRVERKYFEENKYLSSSFADFGYDWEVHPAYRWALQPDDFRDIYNFVALNE